LDSIALHLGKLGNQPDVIGSSPAQDKPELVATLIKKLIDRRKTPRADSIDANAWNFHSPGQLVFGAALLRRSDRSLPAASSDDCFCQRRRLQAAGVVSGSVQPLADRRSPWRLSGWRARAGGKAGGGAAEAAARLARLRAWLGGGSTWTGEDGRSAAKAWRDASQYFSFDNVPGPVLP